MGCALVLTSLDSAAARWVPWAVLAATTTMGAAVLACGAHYPSDVLASVVRVLCTAPLTWVLAARLARQVLPSTLA